MGWDELAQDAGKLDANYNFDKAFFNTFLNAFIQRNYIVFGIFVEIDDLEFKDGEYYPNPVFLRRMVDILNLFGDRTAGWLKEEYFEDPDFYWDNVPDEDKLIQNADYASKIENELFGDESEENIKKAEKIIDAIRSPETMVINDFLRFNLWNAVYIMFKMQQFREDSRIGRQRDSHINGRIFEANVLDDFFEGSTSLTNNETYFSDSCDIVAAECPGDNTGTGSNPQAIYTAGLAKITYEGPSSGLGLSGLESISAKMFDSDVFQNSGSASYSGGLNRFVPDTNLACVSYLPEEKDNPENPIVFNLKTWGQVTRNSQDTTVKMNSYSQLSNWPYDTNLSISQTYKKGRAYDAKYPQLGGVDQDNIAVSDELDYDDTPFIELTPRPFDCVDRNGLPIQGTLFDWIDNPQYPPVLDYPDYDAPKIGDFKYGPQIAGHEDRDPGFDPNTDQTDASGSSDLRFSLRTAINEAGNSNHVLIDYDVDGWDFNPWT